MPKVPGNLACCQSLVAMWHQKSHKIQSGFMGQRGQGGQDFTL